MIQINTYQPNQRPDDSQIATIALFLHKALEGYGDPIHHIVDCISYALSNAPGKGGVVFTALNASGEITGAVVVNHTHMQGYIPEHILVYIAVAPAARGKGIGKKMMLAAINHLPGNIALHVEAENPALKLYEALGFKNKYLEMRLNK